MNHTSQIIVTQASDTVRGLNPQLFGRTIAPAHPDLHPAIVIPPVPVLQESAVIQKLNKTERAWMELRMFTKPKLFRVQHLTIRLADHCRYTPDFFEISRHGEMIAWEVKGFWRDDARVKIKVAASQEPWLQFWAVFRRKGYWHTEHIKP